MENLSKGTPEVLKTDKDISFSWESRSRYCDQCFSSIHDRTLTVSVGEKVIGTFEHDDHFGDTKIDSAEVELAIVKALEIPESDFAGYLARKKELQDAYRLTVFSSDPEDEIKATTLILSLDTLFTGFLTEKGFTITNDDPNGSIGYDYQFMASLFE